MSKFLIELTPVEPYFFGDENAFKAGEKNPSYYITSLPLPPANSVIGMLRYTLLEQSGLLSTDGSYTDTEKVTSLIGGKSYTVNGENSFGAIKSISPLFITDKNGNKYIPTPLNHKTSESKYTPIAMRGNKIKTSHGEIAVPASKEFDAKNTVGSSFMNIDNGEIAKDIISTDSDIRVGIDKNKKDEAFFKKAYCRMKKGYSFAFTAEVDFELKNTICYMGRERSPFVMTVTECDMDIVEDIKKNLNYNFYYAVSDIIITQKPQYNGYAMVRTGHTRMLESEYKNGRVEIKRGSKLYSVIKAGSVFMENPNFANKGFGLNYIIGLGGTGK